MLDHQAVCRPADDDELGRGDHLGELLAVTARRQDVLVADDDEGRHVDRRQPAGERVVGGEDRLDLGGEGLGGATETERSEPADDGHEAPERAGSDHPSSGVAGHRSHAVALGIPGPRLQQLLAPRLVATRRAHERQRTDPFGPGDGEDLGDRPAHRGADDVRLVDADVVEHGHCVGCHLTEVVVAGGLVATA